MDTVYAVMDVLLPFDMFRLQFMKNALLALLLSLLVFVGEAVRDAFDPRKNRL